MKEGWYLIKIGMSEEIEKVLPPTRCVWVSSSSYAYAHPSFSGMITNALFICDKDMIASPAHTIGKEYEFSDDGRRWEKGKFGCHCIGNSENFYRDIDGVIWEMCREIKQPEIEITVKINGNECKLSDISEETLLKIRNMEVK